MSVEPILSVVGLSVSYETAGGPRSALRDVSFDLHRGEALALVGESGSGKSTVALSVLGLAAGNAHAVANRILFEGEDLTRIAETQRGALRGSRIGTVFQDPFTSLNPALPVGYQVAEPLIHHRQWSRAKAMGRAIELLSEVGIADAQRVSDAYPHQLSGGMQQRALIASALACEPTLLLLDEPTTALDVTVEAQILRLLLDLKRRRGLSILFITHNLGIARRFCDRVCVLYAGEVVEQGPVEDLLGMPLHPYAKGLIASSPRISDARDARLRSIPGKIPERAETITGCIFAERCPFVEARCAEPQVLERHGERHCVRCWKFPQLTTSPWPAATARNRSRANRAQHTLVEVRELGKTFDTGSGFATRAIKRVPGRWPTLVPTAGQIKAVDGVTLSIAAGEVLGVVGESGSGKSTLGRTMLRLVEPSAGRILLRGEDITKRRQHELKGMRKELQIVLQNPDSSLNPRKTVEEAIGRSLTLFEDLRGRERRARVEELLAMVELPASYSTRYPHQLSGGEKQRVGIARALASSPAMIVCDEAVSALDVSLQAAILNLLLDMRDEFGLAYLFISHDLSVVAYLADRIAVMYAGRFVELGSRQQILQPPYHPYTRMLLSSAPALSRGVADFAVSDAAAAEHGAPRFDACNDKDDKLVEVAPGHWIAGGVRHDSMAQRRIEQNGLVALDTDGRN